MMISAVIFGRGNMMLA